MEMNRITAGLMKAWGYLGGMTERQSQPRRPKWVYEGMAPVLHKHPLGQRFVDNYKRAIRVDTSRYDGATLRAIRARGGQREMQRRVRQMERRKE